LTHNAAAVADESITAPCSQPASRSAGPAVVSGCSVSQELVLTQVNALYDVATVEEHASYVLCVDGAREMRVAEMSTVRHRYFLHHHADTSNRLGYRLFLF